MSVKTEALKHLMEGDELAGSVVSSWDVYSSQRDEKVKGWKEARNYIFATDTRTTSVNDNTSWKNSTTIPKLTSIRDNLHANYMAALFPNDNWLLWEAHSEDADLKEKRDAIQTYMENKTRESGFRETMSDLVYDWIDTGNAFAGAEFVAEYKTDPETGEKIPKYIGPRAVRLSPYDHVFNPTAVSYENTPKITRYVKSVGELQGDVQNSPELKYSQEVLDKIISNRQVLTTYTADDFDKAEGFLVDGFGSMSEYFGSGYVEILEFEGDAYDPDTGAYLVDHIITVVDRQYVIRKIPNPSWLGKAAKAHVGWRSRPDNLYAMGPLDNLVGMQYRLDHLENLKADAMDLTVHSPLVIKGDVETFTYEPFAQIRIPEDGAVDRLPPDSAVFQVNNEIGYLMSMMEEMAGAPKEAMGIRTPGEKTKFEVQQLQNAAGRIFFSKTLKFELFVEKVLNMMLELSRRYMDNGDLIRVMDDDLGVVNFLKITKEDITGAGVLRPVGARNHAARAQMVQTITTLSTTPIWQQIAPHTSSKKLAKMVEQMLDLDKSEIIEFNVAILEQAETQALMNTAQEQLEIQSATPGTEGEDEGPPLPEEEGAPV
jgi:hypothetical protein